MAKKLYYKIGEACKRLDIQPYVLRYWETEFPLLAPSKSTSGQRVYSEQDLRVIQRIKELLYEEGYTIAGAKKKLEKQDLASLAAVGEKSPKDEDGAEDGPEEGDASGEESGDAGEGADEEDVPEADSPPETENKATAKPKPKPKPKAAKSKAKKKTAAATSGASEARLRRGIREALKEARAILEILDG